MMAKPDEYYIEKLAGKVFGRITVTKGFRRGIHNRPEMFCQCSCGVGKWIRTQELNRKEIRLQSCGCLKKEQLNEKRIALIKAGRNPEKTLRATREALDRSMTVNTQLRKVLVQVMDHTTDLKAKKFIREALGWKEPEDVAV